MWVGGCVCGCVRERERTVKELHRFLAVIYEIVKDGEAVIS